MFHNSFRQFEPLEERMLLSGTGTDLSAIRSMWANFDISEDCKVIEIQPSSLTSQSLQAALDTAATTEVDDVILIHTTNDSCTIEFETPQDELVIDFDSDSYGKVSILAVGEQTLTIDANEHSRIFRIKSGSVQLGNLILTGGLATTNMEGAPSRCGLGGAIANAATLTLDSVIIDGNRADKNDALSVGTYSGLNSQGGGIYNAGKIEIFNATIKNNVATSGEINDDGDAAAYGAGGGIFNHRDGTLIITNSVISHNKAESNDLTNLPDPLPEGAYVTVTVKQNGQGGGLCNYGSLTISNNSVVSDNSARFGGALYNAESSSVTFSGSQVIGNYACESGGGFYNKLQSTVNINHSFIQGNTAGTNGGGIANRGELALINSVLSGNSAGTDGGGLYSDGIYSSSVPVYLVKIVNSTITGNSSGTTTSGSGGGLYFEGVNIKSGNNFATVDIVNSIIVHNRVEKPDNSASDENIYKIGICRGDHSLTTFADWSNSDATNVFYDENVPLFTEEYNFTTKTEGDYRLIYVSQSQALDTGNNDAATSAGLDANSLDLSGRPRIQGTAIDLGAYEFQPTPFDPAFPTQLSVQQGCSLNLQCEGTDRAGNSITKYYVDLDGDGNIDREGNDLWISWRELSNRSGNKGYFWLTVENSLGLQSDSKRISVAIIEVSPCIQVRQIQFYHDQILKLCMDVRYYDRSVKQWTIDWGDGTTPTLYNCLSNSLNVAHYYTPQSESITYNITLSLVDTNDRGGDIVYYIGSHTILVDDTPMQASNPDTLITVDLQQKPSDQKSPVLNYDSGSQTCVIEEFVALPPKNDSLMTVANPNTTSPIEPLLAAALWEQENHSESLGDTRLLCPVRIESKTPVSASAWQYQLLGVAGLNDALARDAAITSLGNDDSDILEGISTASHHASYSLQSSLESELFDNDNLDDLLCPLYSHFDTY
ncbi:MAG: choice-of-anchor Q domain-containing protein [Planctomycetia bacterium]|nr:choice-of-anchor Q domain-containing protein [Planctomycetia bacterium]